MAKRIFCLISSAVFILIFQSYASAQSIPLFGPNKYVRTTGAPNTYSDSFEACNTGATYNLIVENGENGKDRVSSASITLNGIEVVKESEFNQRVEKIEKTISLQKENVLRIKLASGPGGFIKVNIYCVANCLEVDIASPSDGNTINKSRAIIQGSLYNAFGEIGVILQSSGASGQVSALAQRQGTTFAGIVFLQQGQNTITATATDACGYKATDTITINTEAIEEQIRLTAIPTSGIPILNLTFEAEAFLANPVSNYSWDFDGDGTPDQTGSSLSKLTTQYQYPGLYFPKVTITDTQGNTYEETTIVNVLSKEEMDTLFKGKWEGMKEELVSGDVENALKYFHGGSQERYREMFKFIENELPSIVANMQEIQLIYIRGEIAKYRIRREQEIKGVLQTITYYIYFVPDENGLWKIESF